MSWFGQALDAYYRSKEASADALGRGITGAADAITGAIQRAGQDKAANQLSSQLANSGNYAPRADLVSPGVDPITGAINTIKAGTPASVLTQGGVVGMMPSTHGTAPVVATGGEQGLKNRIEAMKLQQEMAGGTPIQQALERARLENTQAHTDYLRSIPEENRQDRLEKNRQQQETRDQAAWDKTHTHTSATLENDILKTDPGKDSGPWKESLNGNTGHQGSFINGVWKNDPANGTMYSVDDVDGNGGIPDGTPQNTMKHFVPIETAKRWRTTFDNVNQNNGSWVEPRPNASSTAPSGTTQTPPAGGGGPAISSKAQYDNLPSGAPFTWKGRPGVKP